MALISGRDYAKRISHLSHGIYGRSTSDFQTHLPAKTHRVVTSHAVIYEAHQGFAVCEIARILFLYLSHESSVRPSFTSSSLEVVVSCALRFLRNIFHGASKRLPIRCSSLFLLIKRTYKLIIIDNFIQSKFNFQWFGNSDRLQLKFYTGNAIDATVALLLRSP